MATIFRTEGGSASEISNLSYELENENRLNAMNVYCTLECFWNNKNSANGT